MFSISVNRGSKVRKCGATQYQDASSTQRTSGKSPLFGLVSRQASSGVIIPGK